MNERWKYAKKIDFLLLSIIFVLFCFGLIGISVAMKNPTAEDEIGFLQSLESFELRYVILALIWFCTGCVLTVIATIINYRSLKTWIPYFYAVIMVALVAVYFLGTSAGGATSWFQLGPFKFQPSEFAKPVLILALAAALSSPRFEDGIRRWRDLFILGAIIAPPFLLIMIQPDMGTAMVIAFITLFMIFASGISLKLVIPSVAVVGGGALVVWNFILNNAQKNRILVFMDPSLDPLGAGYHLNQSLIAVGSGKFFGKGIFGETTLSQLDYLPAKHTDFIFAVIVEAMGLVAGVAIILLFMLMLWRIIRIGLHSQDKIGKLICMGVAAMLAAHIFENIGMTMGITPITGIPLPFLSYGGSSMWTNLISIGLVTSVAIRRESDVFSDEKNKYHVASGPLDISLK